MNVSSTHPVPPAVLRVSHGHRCGHGGGGGGGRRGSRVPWRRQRRPENHHQEGGEGRRRPSLLSHTGLCTSSPGATHTPQYFSIPTTTDTTSRRNVCLQPQPLYHPRHPAPQVTCSQRWPVALHLNVQWHNVYSPCNLTAWTNPTEIVCGAPVLTHKMVNVSV